MHAPITLSGNKYALNKIYALNKQVSVCGKGVLLKYKYIFICTYWLWIYVSVHALRAFSITTPLNARLRKVGVARVLHGAEKSCTR